MEDEAAIRNLAAAFADAATRHNMEKLSATYKSDGVLTIGAPLLNSAKGVEAVVAFISRLRSDKEFFVQFVHSGVIKLNGNSATAQWLIEEAAKGGEKLPRLLCRLRSYGEGRWEMAVCGEVFSLRVFRFFSVYRERARSPPALMTS